MRKLILAVIFTVIAALAAGVYAAAITPKSAGSVVQISVADGKGSGVHIGKGLIVTAAHVTSGQKQVTVVNDRGLSEPAEVVWENTDYDVAIVQTGNLHPTRYSSLHCKPNFIGQHLSMQGSPAPFEYVRSPGVVIGRAIPALKLAAALPVSGVAAPGMSGGPAFDTSGRVVGIVVAGLRSNPSLALIVPASAICELLGTK